MFFLMFFFIDPTEKKNTTLHPHHISKHIIN